MNDLTSQYSTQIYPGAGPSTDISNTCTTSVSSPVWGAPNASQPAPPSPASTSVPSGPGPIRRRRFSAARIQPTRIKKVMQADEEIGRMVASVPVAIGRAMEHFAEKFLLASAQVTQAFSSRTLTPVHMKIAMLNSPSFRFLENVMKEIGIPARMDNESAKFQNIPQQSFPHPMENYPMSDQVLSPVQMPGNLPPIGMAFNYPPASPLSVYDSVPPIQNEVPELIQKKPARRSVDMPEGEKPKRGRPKKKKDDKCLDDALCAEATHCIEQEDKDRELMPPPPLPLGISRAKPMA